MKAMILCAGLGTRLKPWTLSHPKALVPVAGVPMLKRVADRLVGMGFDEIVLNVHHFSDQIVSFVKSGEMPTDNIHISDESEFLLDTGGGILNAESFLAKDERPFLVHNVDILSNADLVSLYEHHSVSGNDVTLLVSDRDSSRKLVFDSSYALKGWINLSSDKIRPESLRMDDTDIVEAFSGVYVMSPKVLKKMREHGFNGKFPIMDFFLSGFPDVKIGGMSCENLRIMDIGKPETLEQANNLL